MDGTKNLRERLNDDRRRRFGTEGRSLALVCECGDPACGRTVVLSCEEYDARRPGVILHADHTSALPPDPSLGGESQLSA